MPDFPLSDGPSSPDRSPGRADLLMSYGSYLTVTCCTFGGMSAPAGVFRLGGSREGGFPHYLGGVCGRDYCKGYEGVIGVAFVGYRPVGRDRRFFLVTIVVGWDGGGRLSEH